MTYKVFTMTPSHMTYPGFQRLFQRGFRFLSSLSPLVASAYDRRGVGLRPTPSLRSRRRKGQGVGDREEGKRGRATQASQHRKFPPHARKTSGTQGTLLRSDHVTRNELAARNNKAQGLGNVQRSTACQWQLLICGGRIRCRGQILALILLHL